MDTEVVGHELLRDRLRQSLVRQELPSTLLFSGLPGIGKSLVARETLRAVLCATPEEGHACRVCSSCRMSFSGNHPDLHVVECSDRSTWDIDGFRELMFTLSLRAFAGGARCVLLRDADTISPYIANALLKTLEEPRPLTYFVLTASNPSKLPVTILSRCQRWSFSPLSGDDLARVIRRLEGADADLGRLLQLRPDLLDVLEGSLENLDLLRGAIDEWDQIAEMLTAVERGEVRDLVKFATHLSKDKAALSTKLRMIRIFAARRMRDRPDREARVKWSVIVSNAISAEYLIVDRNVSSMLVVMNALIPLLPEGAVRTLPELPWGGALLEEIVGR